MPQDFTKGKIYKITNDYNEDVYIGSTCDLLTKRFSGHKSDCMKDKQKNRPLIKLMNEVGFERFRIELIEDYPCQDRYQLRQREGHWIREIGTLNKVIAGRTVQEKQKEWYEKNKERVIQRQKEFVAQNKEKVVEYQKTYRIQNIQKTSEYNQKYRQKNIQKYMDYLKDYYEYNRGSILEKITCDCGCIINQGSYTRHLKTQKHQNFLKK